MGLVDVDANVLRTLSKGCVNCTRTEGEVPSGSCPPTFVGVIDDLLVPVFGDETMEVREGEIVRGRFEGFTVWSFTPVFQSTPRWELGSGDRVPGKGQ